jgi:hypothetical protein
VRRRLVPSLLGAVLLASASTHAQATPTPTTQEIDAACTAAYTGAQRLRKKGQFRAAKAQLEACARPACSPVLRGDCTQWLGEVDSAMPSVVVAARMPSGDDAMNVRVLVDGAVLTEKVGGLALDVDPGPHLFRFEAPGGQPIEKQFVIREGEKARRIDITFTAAPAPTIAPGPAPAATPGSNPDSSADAEPPAEPKGPSFWRTIPAPTYALGGLALVGLGLGAALEIIGLGKRGDLDACKPNCTPDDVSSARNTVLAGDISLAVGLAAAAGAVYFFVTRPAIRATAAPTAGGMVFGVSGVY